MDTRSPNYIVPLDPKDMYAVVVTPSPWEAAFLDGQTIAPKVWIEVPVWK